MAVEKYKKENVLALTAYYGQRHEKELQAARKVAAYYGVQQEEINLAQAGGEGTVETYVPFRNGLFLSFAAAVAVSVHAEVIYYGAHADDAAGRAYPDCTPEFEQAMNTAIYEGSGHTCHLEAPLLAWNKAGVVKEGLRLGAPYELTWSCYEGGDMPCGVCGTCRDRAAAFAANGVPDPALKK